MNKPFCATSAFSNNEVSFDKYVTLQPSSLNNAWLSKLTHALLTDKLCAPIILGLLFLQYNDLVIDHSTRTIIDHSTCTIIDKKCDFDLLDEKTFKGPSKLVLAPHQKHIKMRNYRKEFLIELKWKCSQRKKTLEDNNSFENLDPVSPIATITMRIQQLASKDKLITLENELKEEYKEIFEPIPHANLLPTDYYACMLKEAEKTILLCSYTCPHQFKQAFATLIDQHLESGFIRHSTSQHLSASFIIPKADPKALPRWVCDYRQLNANTVPNNYPLPKIDEILNNCAKGKIWAKIDMTDSFFQTCMHPDDIKYTAVSTPHGTFLNGLLCQWV